MFFYGTCKDGAWRTENPLLRCDLPLRLLTSARTACGADPQDIQPANIAIYSARSSSHVIIGPCNFYLVSERKLLIQSFKCLGKFNERWSLVYIMDIYIPYNPSFIYYEQGSLTKPFRTKDSIFFSDFAMWEKV